MGVPVANFPPVINISKWEVIRGLLYNIHRPLLFVKVLEGLLNMNCFQITLGSFFILIDPVGLADETSVPEGKGRAVYLTDFT